MSGNESSSSDRERSTSLIRSNNDQGQRSKEVSPNLGKPLKEQPKRKRPKRRINLPIIKALMKKSLTEKAIKKVKETTSI